MRRIDRLILGSIALGIWTLIVIALAPQPALSQSDMRTNLMALVSEELGKVACRFEGTAATGGTISGDFRCHM